LIDVPAHRFDEALSSQRSTITLPGEHELTEQSAQAWSVLLAHCRTVWNEPDAADRARQHLDAIHRESQAVQSLARQLTHMNIAALLSEHGRIAGIVDSASYVLHGLILTGLILAVVFAGILAQTILQPIRLLTSSAQQIERGNLDLTLPIASDDELGQLAASFNRMTERLREYRRIEHERLVRTERTTQLAIDSIPDSVVVLTADGGIELTNERARQLLALDERRLRDGLRRLAASDTPPESGYTSTIEITHGPDEVHYLLPRRSPIHDEQGRAIGHTVVLADVTELRRLDEMKNALLSMVSHELKTPLTSMRLILHMLAGDMLKPGDTRQHELLVTARDDCDRLHRIVETLVDMDRIESGKALMEQRPCSAAELVDAAAAPLRDLFAQQHVDLAVDIPSDVPLVSADPVRVTHVIANLLHNALRYTPEQGRVSVSVRRQDAFVEFRVSDSGHGIPPQYAHRVFEKFFRAPGQASGSGFGLGLSICKNIIEAHGGEIALVSTSERTGTTFRFTLRCASSG
jgi:signal transduction histidine kinase